MFNLIKKDYLIVKKIWIGVMIVAVLIPVFLSFAGGGITIPSILTLTIMSILLAIILFSSIDEEEEKYPKAAALITTIGYSRNIQVIKRYVLIMIVYLYSTIIYIIESLFITELENITLFSFIFSIFCFTIIASLYLSLTTLFGVKAGRYIVMFVIVLISIGPIILSRLNVNINFSFIKSLNESILIALLLGITATVYGLSLRISINSYSKKEL